MALSLALALGVTAAWAQDAGLPGPTQGALLPGTGTISSASARPAPPQGNGVQDENYHLGTGDKMKVTVYGEEDLSGEFLVNGSGQVQYPLVGQVNAAGLSIHEFVTVLTGVLGAKYLKDPKISVEIENYRPFYIMGEVNKPGEYPFENGLNVMGAVALAGGFTYRANDTTVRIRRKGDTKDTAVPANADTRISPGDVVRISERMF